MSWVRLDDGFTSNPKVIQLTDQQFRVWVKVLCHCAGVGDPTVDRFTVREVPGLTWHRIRVYFSLGLLDSSALDSERVYEVHDYEKYLPKDVTNSERQARWRARKRVTSTVTPSVTENVTNGVTESLPSRARVPVPSRPVEEKQASKSSSLGLSEARPEERLPIEKERLAIELKAVAPLTLDGAATIDSLCSQLPEGSLAKVLESVAAKRGTVGPGYVINALRSEKRELNERSVA